MGTDRDDLIKIPNAFGETIMWTGAQLGWRRFSQEGDENHSTDYGPLDSFAAPHLLNYFGLQARDVPTERLALTSPHDLRNLSSG